MNNDLILKSLLAIRKMAEESVFVRGQAIHADGGVKITDFDDYGVSFRVRCDTEKRKFDADLWQLDFPTEVGLDCECHYSLTNSLPCKHVIAGTFALEEQIQPQITSVETRRMMDDLSPDEKMALGNDLVEEYVRLRNQAQTSRFLLPKTAPKPAVVEIASAGDTTIELKDLADSSIRWLVESNFWTNRRHYQAITSAEQGNGHETLHLVIKKYGLYTIRVSRVKKGQYHLSCSCNRLLAKKGGICEHQMGALLWMANLRGTQALELLRDLTTEKNALLADFGYSVADNLVGRFDFKLNPYTNKLELTQLDKSIQRIAGQDWSALLQKTLPATPVALPALSVAKKAETKTVQGYLFTGFDRKGPPFFQLDLLKGTLNTKTGKLTNVDRQHPYERSRPQVDATDLEIMNLSRQLDRESLNDYLQQQGFKLSRHSWDVRYTDEMHLSLLQWSLQLLDDLLPRLADKPVRVLKGGGSAIGSICTVEDRPLTLHFKLQRNKTETALNAYARTAAGELVQFERLTDLGTDALILIDGERLARFGTVDAALMAWQFLDFNGALRFRSLRDEAFFNGFLIPLANRFSVDFGEDGAIQAVELDFAEGRVYLKEDEQNLLLIPTFAYHDPAAATTDATTPPELIEMANDYRPARIVAHNGQVSLQRRDAEAEETFVDYLRAQHPDFAAQSGGFFHLSAEQVLHEGWLYAFYEALRLNNTRLFGVSTLKKFRQNPYPVAFQIRQSSGIDWFDLKVEISFGDQSVSLADVRKAILKKQNFVELGDGSIGMLPDEWVQKHAQLFRLGQVDNKNDTIRLSKRHFTLLEHYRDLINDPKLLKELDDKKEKLLNFREIKKVKLPKNVKATLRPYQEEGYRWLNFLDEFGWGGCLADDMGLGKTLQMLTFLQAQKNKRPDGLHLVVLPKTLVFNWQAEAARFCPDLRLHVHTGTGRAKNADGFADTDIVLTTYGAVRYDIDWLRNVRFDYVVLDESQAIKNPGSQISKAVKLLRARNRMAMTGTPVENNTFDLYSQFDFLNPGFLGSEELFRTEYANPIDRQQDAARATELRQLIYPFLLKRTKDEVAKDLPDKTETILYCEMGKQQRRVYEAFRDRYRDLIEGKISQEGADKAAFLILEGLLKLRQICDSPALVKTDEDYGHDSAKLDELLREIEENASNHKIVVFSQFLGMLDLVRQRLDRDRVPYEYLDGQTQDRAGRVQHFQNNADCRVFLMSLKAGGVGLNLTEADYVYLIDPWWNPAVEQQAIDRVHRIGQTKRVFAYRMICKDTVEEKILILQDRKRALASELISTEAGFLKKLSPADIINLFR